MGGLSRIWKTRFVVCFQMTFDNDSSAANARSQVLDIAGHMLVYHAFRATRVVSQPVNEASLRQVSNLIRIKLEPLDINLLSQPLQYIC